MILLTAVRLPASVPSSTFVFFFTTISAIFSAPYHLFYIPLPSTFLYIPPIFLYPTYSDHTGARSLPSSYINPFELYKRSLQPAHTSPQVYPPGPPPHPPPGPTRPHPARHPTTVGKVDLNLKGEILTLYANIASHGDWQHRCRTHCRSSRMFGCCSSRGREIGEDQTRKVASAASPPR